MNLYITGHSLGGALAMLCGMALQERKLAHGEFQHLNLRAVVTFGQPRIGNAEMCTVVDSTLHVPLLRIVHKDVGSSSSHLLWPVFSVSLLYIISLV